MHGGGGKLQAMVVGGRQSCHEYESERNQEEAWLYGVPQWAISQPQCPIQRQTQQTQHKDTRLPQWVKKLKI